MQRKIDLTELARLVEQGMTNRELAQHFDAHPTTIRKTRKQLGIDNRDIAPKIDRDRVKALVDEGFTNVEIADKLGCHQFTISRIRGELGISHHYRGRTMTPERLAEIERLVEDGCSWKEIQRTTGADRDTLAKYFPGTAWTTEQTVEHVRALRAVSHFNRRPRDYDRSKYPNAA